MKKLYFILGLLFFITPLAAKAEEAKHLCQSSELAGLWQTAGFKENPPGPLTENFKMFPYEYLIFDGRENFAYDARQKAADVNFKSKDDLTNFIKQVYAHSKLAGKFNFSVENGILNIHRDDKPWQKFQCFIMDADMPNGMKKNDMVWIASSGPNSSLVRIERHVIKK
jgi:hypothetical protein